MGRKRIRDSGVIGLHRWMKTDGITERTQRRRRAGLGGHEIESSIWGMLVIGQPRAEVPWTVTLLNGELRREAEAGGSNLGGIRV